MVFGGAGWCRSLGRVPRGEGRRARRRGTDLSRTLGRALRASAARGVGAAASRPACCRRRRRFRARARPSAARVPVAGAQRRRAPRRLAGVRRALRRCRAGGGRRQHRRHEARLQASPLVARASPTRSVPATTAGTARIGTACSGGEWAQTAMDHVPRRRRAPRSRRCSLRTFVRDEADPDHAYFFDLYRMVGDEEHYDLAPMLVGRLFSYRPGLELPNERLHILPIPTSIPSPVASHHASYPAPRRSHRRGPPRAVREVQEADPEGDFQADYSNLLVPTGRSVSGSPDRWSSRLSLMGEAPVAPGA